MKTEEPVDPCIVRARQIVAESAPQTAFIRRHFAGRRSRDLGDDSTTEGTIKALHMLLSAYKRFHPKQPLTAV